MMTSRAPAFAAWLDRFLDEYYRRRPVNATFIGVHDFDASLPDFSENGAGDAVAGMQRLLAEARSLPVDRLAEPEAVDGRLAEGFLRIQLWEYASDHFWRGNPCVYTGEAAFGVIGLFLTPFAPLPERAGAAIERLRAIPALLGQGQSALRSAPEAWIERALRECQGLGALLGGGIERLIEDEQIARSSGPAAAEGLRAAAAEALQAVGRFRAYLEDDLRPRATEAYGCGAAGFDLYIRQGHCLDMPTSEILSYAEDRLAAAEAEISGRASEFGAATWQEALSALAGLHPEPDRYYGRFGEVWTACRAAVVAQDLLTWPEFPIEYVPQPAWAREAASHLYFLHYRAPAAFNRPPVHQYLVPPLDPASSREEQERFLRTVNDATIKLNHVVHHGGTGHHVQNWHAYHAASRIGQIAAVDCASRIAMFCGGTMAEGWACYATELMAEAGFLTPLETYSELQTRLRMAARGVVDCRLHCGMMTLSEAAAFYRDRAGMSPEAARSEAVKNSMFPGAAMMYLLGADHIHDLRTEMKALQGDAFSLRGFHDRFLSYGSIPVALIAESMRRAEQGVDDAE